MVAASRPTESARAAAATLLSLLAHGERTAMRGAHWQARMTAEAPARRFLYMQARHEAFHARVFETASLWITPDESLGATESSELAMVEQRLGSACDRGDFAAALLIQQVFLEGLGHVVLRRLDRQMAGSGCLVSLRGLILRQEEAHNRFGLNMLARCVEEEPGVRTRLAPLGRELFDIATVLLARLDETLVHVDADFTDYAADLRDTLPDWLRDET